MSTFQRRLIDQHLIFSPLLIEKRTEFNRLEILFRGKCAILNRRNNSSFFYVLSISRSSTFEAFSQTISTRALSRYYFSCSTFKSSTSKKHI